MNTNPARHPARRGSPCAYLLTSNVAYMCTRSVGQHMAALHAAFWGWRDEIGLTPLANRYLAMAPAVATAEAALGSTAPIPPLLGMGWSRLPSVAPALVTCDQPTRSAQAWR